MSRLHIFIVAPYPKFEAVAKEVIKDFSETDFTIVVGDEFNVIPTFNSYPPGTFHAAVTRGAIATILRTFTSIPVIETNVSILDIIRIINLEKFRNEKIGIVGYSSVIKSANTFLEILKYDNVEIYAARYTETSPRVQQLAARGFSTIIGDVPSVAAAKNMGLEGFLIESPEDCIRQAIQDSIYHATIVSSSAIAVQNVAKEQPLICEQKSNLFAVDLTLSLDEINKAIIHQVFKEEGLNQSATAKRLGISRNTVWRKLQDSAYNKKS